MVCCLSVFCVLRGRGVWHECLLRDGMGIGGGSVCMVVAMLCWKK